MVGCELLGLVACGWGRARAGLAGWKTKWQSLRACFYPKLVIFSPFSKELLSKISFFEFFLRIWIPERAMYFKEKGGKIGENNNV